MFDTIVVYSSDTDVLLLCLACHQQVEWEGSTCTVFCKIVLGSSLGIHNVNVSARAMSLNTYRALFSCFNRVRCCVKLFQLSKKSM